ncbi:MAG: type II secretion system protein [Chloroflexi bacterium]|nr:type II secretion system protein [Chloroflexota bacterium]
MNHGLRVTQFLFREKSPERVSLSGEGFRGYPRLAQKVILSLAKNLAKGQTLRFAQGDSGLLIGFMCKAGVRAHPCRGKEAHPPLSPPSRGKGGEFMKDFGAHPSTPARTGDPLLDFPREKRATVRNQKGFTFIEIIITVGLLGVALLVITQGLALAIKNADRAKDRVTMLNMAKGQLEYIMKQPYDDVPAAYATVTPTPARYTVAVNVSVPVSYTYPSPYATPVSETVQLVTVTVTGDYGSLSISDYRVRR